MPSFNLDKVAKGRKFPAPLPPAKKTPLPPVLEKNLRDEDLKADIAGDETLGQQIADEKGQNPTGEEVIEKVLEDTDGQRNDVSQLKVPPMAALNEKLRRERLKDFNTDKDPHWSQTFNEGKQHGALPDWPVNKGQHHEVVLQNDPRRFEGVDQLPVDPTAGSVPKKQEPKPLVGDITTADINRVVMSIKQGDTIDYDAAIAAVLGPSEDEKRELTPQEKRAIGELKAARTKAMIG